MTNSADSNLETNDLKWSATDRAVLRLLLQWAILRECIALSSEPYPDAPLPLSIPESILTLKLLEQFGGMNSSHLSIVADALDDAFDDLKAAGVVLPVRIQTNVTITEGLALTNLWLYVCPGLEYAVRIERIRERLKELANIDDPDMSLAEYSAKFLCQSNTVWLDNKGQIELAKICRRARGINGLQETKYYIVRLLQCVTCQHPLTFDEIKKYLGFSKRRLAKSLDWLIKAEWVDKIRDGRGRVVYGINILHEDPNDDGAWEYGTDSQTDDDNPEQFV